MIKKKNRNIVDRLKIGGLIGLILAIMVLFSGCVGQESAKSPASTQTATTTTPGPQTATTPGSVIESGTSGLYITQDDVKGLTLKQYSFIAASESVTYNISTRSTMETYKDTLPLGKRNVGQVSMWDNPAGRVVRVSVDKFDTNDRIPETFAGFLTSCERTIKSGEWKKRGDTVEAGCGQTDIGVNAYYAYTITTKNPDLKQVIIQYFKGNTFVTVLVQDLKGKSYDEAIELATKISRKLN